jgi:hypothetical protein
MKTKATLSLFIVLLMTPDLFAQQRMVSECANKPSIKDSKLQTAIQKSIGNNSAIEFLTEGSPCQHTKRIVNALNRTINKNYFNLALNHSFSSITNGGNSFSVERFIFKNNQTAALIAKSLKDRSTNTLQIESFTMYDLFLIENNLIIFIADRQSYQFNKPLFSDIKDNFQAGYKLNHK